MIGAATQLHVRHERRMCNTKAMEVGIRLSYSLGFTSPTSMISLRSSTVSGVNDTVVMLFPTSIPLMAMSKLNVSSSSRRRGRKLFKGPA